MRRSRLIVILALIFALAPLQAMAQNIVNPRYGNGEYLLGPYPFKQGMNGVDAQLYGNLIFRPVIEGRANPTYKLYLKVMVQLTGLGPAVKGYVDKNYSQDNCGRINAVDNWVYTVKNTRLRVVDRNTLRITSEGSVSTWTCTEGIPETVCDSYSDSFGISWPYNCKLRPKVWKAQNFEQGFEVVKDTWVDSTANSISFKNYDPVATPDNNTVIQNIFNGVFRHFAKTDETINRNATLSPRTIEVIVPTEYQFLNPRIEFAGFQSYKDEPFLVATYSVAITREQINAFMSRFFGSIYKPIAAPVVAPINPGSPTKSSVRAECAEHLRQHPGDTVEKCAALLGLPYSELPD